MRNYCRPLGAYAGIGQNVQGYSPELMARSAAVAADTIRTSRDCMPQPGLHDSVGNGHQSAYPRHRHCALRIALALMTGQIGRP